MRTAIWVSGPCVTRTTQLTVSSHQGGGRLGVLLGRRTAAEEAQACAEATKQRKGQTCGKEGTRQHRQLLQESLSDLRGLSHVSLYAHHFVPSYLRTCIKLVAIFPVAAVNSCCRPCNSVCAHFAGLKVTQRSRPLLRWFRNIVHAHGCHCARPRLSSRTDSAPAPHFAQTGV
jgi:hypothetical protein